MNSVFGFKRDEMSAGNQLGLAYSLPDGAISLANYFASRWLWFQFIQFLTYFLVYQFVQGAHCCAV